jgi:hypothetical protein
VEVKDAAVCSTPLDATTLERRLAVALHGDGERRRLSNVDFKLDELVK